jgi:hypothetical protein
MSPKVTICIPAYNREDYIRDALNCALAQTFADFEVVVTDNNSSDRTVAVVKEYAARDNRIHIYEFDKNVGAVGNFNRCIQHAKGTYIKFLMSDDLMSPDCLEKMVQAMEANPNVSLVAGIQEDRTFDGTLVRSNTVCVKTEVVSGFELAKKLLLRMCNDIGAPTAVMMRRQLCAEGFKPQYFYSNDLEMWLRMLLKGDFYFIHEPLTTVRLHGGTMTSAYSKTLLHLADQLRLRDEYRQFMQTQGMTEQEWTSWVDERIIATVDYMLLEEKLNIDEVRTFASKVASIVGPDYYEELIRTFATLVFYAFERVHVLNIDARWNRGQVSNLEKVIDGMQSTFSWKMTEPIRKLREKTKSPN